MTDKIIDITDARAARAKDSDDPQHVANVGGSIDETIVSLCIYGDDLDSDEISQMLGVSPTHTHRKGERRKSRSSRPEQSAPFKSGTWILEVRDQAPREPEELTRTLLDQLPNDEAVWLDLAARFELRLKFGLFVEAWNRGFDLSPELVARIGRMRVGLGFDIYADLKNEGE